MGVKDEWYYVFRPGNNPGPKVGDYYYSARDWGHGGLARNGDKNRLTFVEAIKQYYRYSVEGKRNAYLMLGHVAHLLQDSGQPDHATLTPHVSSSEDGAFVEEIYCPLHAAAIATMKCKIWLLASAAAFAAGNWATAAVAFGTWLTCTATETGIHSAACLLAVDASHVGYEELIGTYWRTTAQELTNLLTTAAIVSCQNYDEYFGKLADFAAAQPKKYGLQSPLGCSSLGLLPPFGKIPSLLPTIDPASDQAKAPYFKLTDALVAEIVGYTAGFVEYFQEIVNYPPILERVAIVQWEPHDTPRRFAFFKNDAEHCLRYDAEWKMAAKGKSRTLTQHATQPALQNIFPAISPDRSVYLFLRFGPTIGLTRDVAKGTVAAQVTGRVMNEDTLTLRLTANHLDPRTGQPIDHTVNLVRADDDDGPYYWGEYTPHNCCSDAYLLTLTVDGEDTLAHLAGRSGSKLDPDPAKTAQVNADSGHPFSWQAGSYIPGADTNHQIWVDAYKGAKLVVTPARLEIDVSAADPSADALLAVKQQARKCNWEIREALTNCPVTWELVPKVSKDIEIVRGGIVIPGQYTEIPAVFGLQVDLTASPTGTARVAVRVTKAGRDTAGTYTIKVNYTINTGLLPSTSQIVEIPVEVK